MALIKGAWGRSRELHEKAVLRHLRKGGLSIFNIPDHWDQMNSEVVRSKAKLVLKGNDTSISRKSKLYLL